VEMVLHDTCLGSSYWIGSTKIETAATNGKRFALYA